MTPKGSPTHSLSLILRLKDLHKSYFYDIISIYIIGNQIICRKLCFLIHILFPYSHNDALIFFYGTFFAVPPEKASKFLVCSPECHI